MIGLFRRLPWIYQIGVIVAVVALFVVLGFLALQQFQAGDASDQPDETVDIGGAAQFVPQGEQPQGVHVIGVGELVLAPDLAILAFAVEAEDPSGTTATERAQAAATAVREAVDGLDGLNINDQDLRTGGIVVTPVFSTGRGPAAPTGYIAATTITVRLRDVNRVADVIDSALSAGAAELLELRYTLVDEQQAEQDALRLASVHAAGRARAIAEAIQGRVAGLINIEEEVAVRSPTIEGTSLAPGAPAQIDEPAAYPGQVHIRAVVRANFAFE